MTERTPVHGEPAPGTIADQLRGHASACLTTAHLLYSAGVAGINAGVSDHDAETVRDGVAAWRAAELIVRLLESAGVDAEMVATFRQADQDTTPPAEVVEAIALAQAVVDVDRLQQQT